MSLLLHIHSRGSEVGAVGNKRAHTYVVRPVIGGPPVLVSNVDRQAETITAHMLSGGTVTMDVITARALWMTIQEAVYEERSLRQGGPTLAMECDRGAGRSLAVRRDL